MTTLKKYNQDTGQWEYVLSGPRGVKGDTGAKGDKGDPGGFTTSNTYTGDFNALTTAGLYWVSSANSTTANNSPSNGVGGHLEVLNSGTGSIEQRFHNHSNETYSRVSTNGGTAWGAWALVGAKPVADHVAQTDPHPQYAMSAAPAPLAQRAYNNVWLANAATPAASHTGAIQVAIPIDAAASTMLEVEVELAAYDNDAISRSVLKASVYSQSNGGLTRTAARIESTGQFRTQTSFTTYPTVRWIRAVSGTFLYLVLGDVASTASYVQAGVRRVSAHYLTGGVLGQPTITAVTSLPTGNVASVTLVDTLGVYRGTGMPEGLVAAAIGAEYVDLAATNGAIKWVKTTAIGSPTGWKVVYGDTGWRLVTITPHANHPGIVDYYVRRVNDTTTVKIREGATASAAGAGLSTLTNLPVGFRANAAVDIPVAPVMSSQSGAPLPNENFYISAGSALVLYRSGAVANRSSSVTFMANDSWPTTLPGTAV